MDGSLLWIAIFTGVIAFANFVLLVGLAAGAFAVKRLIDSSVRPTMADVHKTVKEVQVTVKGVQETASKVEESVQHIAEVSEQTVRKVSGKVVATTELVQDAVASPIISVASILTGVARAVDTLRRSPDGDRRTG